LLARFDPMSKVVDQEIGHPRTQISTGTTDTPNSREQFFGRCVFEEIPACAEIHALDQVILIAIHAQKEYFRRRITPYDLARRLEAARSRHADVEQYQIGAKFRNYIGSLRRVGRFPDHAYIGFGRKKITNPLTEERVVVCDQHAKFGHSYRPPGKAANPCYPLSVLSRNQTRY